MKRLTLTILALMTSAFVINAQEIIKTKPIEQTQIKSPTLIHPEAKSEISKKDSSVVITMYCGNTKLDSTKMPMYVFNIDKKQYKINGIEIIINKNIASVPTNQIESINILKDKEATEIYGNDAKNGVIIIKFKEDKDEVYAYKKKLKRFINKKNNPTTLSFSFP